MITEGPPYAGSSLGRANAKEKTDEIPALMELTFWGDPEAKRKYLSTVIRWSEGNGWAGSSRREASRSTSVQAPKHEGEPVSQSARHGCRQRTGLGRESLGGLTPCEEAAWPAQRGGAERGALHVPGQGAGVRPEAQWESFKGEK